MTTKQITEIKNQVVNVTDFNLTAPALREAVDLIADRAMEGIEQINQAMATAPVEAQTLLNELRVIFGSIGHVADASSDDVNVDLHQVWGVAAALSCS